MTIRDASSNSRNVGDGVLGVDSVVRGAIAAHNQPFACRPDIRSEGPRTSGHYADNIYGALSEWTEGFVKRTNEKVLQSNSLATRRSPAIVLRGSTVSYY